METIRKADTSQKKRARNLVLHLHPVKLRKEAIKFQLTFGLGGMSALLFLLLVFTGILLRFTYVASPNEAYDSILAIENDIFFGQFVRNIHHWSGIFLVVITFLHLVRTFYTGAFYYMRRWNWVIGVCLMILVIFSNFTGYLLPWDQLAYWAITVSTSMLQYVPVAGNWLVEFVRGGVDVNASTLLIFYNFHTAILPLTIVILMVFHFWRVRKAGGVVVSENSSREMVSSDPDLVLKELVTGLILLAFIFMISVFFNAPLLERADPAFSPNPAKAPWYFMGIQELLMHFHPFFSAILIPALLVVGMIWLPFLHFNKRYEGVWFLNDKGKKLAMLATFISISSVTTAIVISEFVVDFEGWFPRWPLLISSGLIPFMLVAGLFVIMMYMIKKYYKTDKSEFILFAATFMIVAYILFSITAIFFRGPGMQLMWPWNI
ncbi:MAG: cytochrome b N-terminal domain-containing protein [Bacteroidales bacterium]|nr:cytochrome b N-terminal domain-containing protein [Bacteroidales bacterium]